MEKIFKKFVPQAFFLFFLESLVFSSIEIYLFFKASLGQAVINRSAQALIRDRES